MGRLARSAVDLDSFPLGHQRCPAHVGMALRAVAVVAVFDMGGARPDEPRRDGPIHDVFDLGDVHMDLAEAHARGFIGGGGNEFDG